MQRAPLVFIDPSKQQDSFEQWSLSASFEETQFQNRVFRFLEHLIDIPFASDMRAAQLDDDDGPSFGDLLEDAANFVVDIHTLSPCTDKGPICLRLYDLAEQVGKFLLVFLTDETYRDYSLALIRRAELNTHDAFHAAILNNIPLFSCLCRAGPQATPTH